MVDAHSSRCRLLDGTTMRRRLRLVGLWHSVLARSQLQLWHTRLVERGRQGRRLCRRGCSRIRAGIVLEGEGNMRLGVDVRMGGVAGSLYWLSISFKLPWIYI